MASMIERVLARVRLENQTYSPESLRAAEQRVAARVADRLLHGALTFDDAMQPVRERTITHRQSIPMGLSPDFDEAITGACRDLQILCEMVVSREDALHQMSCFIGDRVLEPEGALVLGCVLQLASRGDTAQFWWQFAAGAGDTVAAYCLNLHHMALGEIWEADWWCSQVDPDYGPVRVPRVCLNKVRALALGQPGTSTVVKTTLVTKAAAAVVVYVAGAMEYVDDVDLPLPPQGFAERIEELTAKP